MDRNVECPKYFLSAATCCGLGSVAEDIVTLKNKTDSFTIRTRLVILTHTHRRRNLLSPVSCGQCYFAENPDEIRQNRLFNFQKPQDVRRTAVRYQRYRYRQSAASHPSRLMFVFGFRCECEKKNRHRQTPNTNRTRVRFD